MMSPNLYSKINSLLSCYISSQCFEPHLKWYHKRTVPARPQLQTIYCHLQSCAPNTMQNFAFIKMCYCVDKTMSFCNVPSIKTANQVTLIKTVFQNISIHPATVLKSDCSWCTVKDCNFPKCDVIVLPLPTSYIVTIMWTPPLTAGHHLCITPYIYDTQMPTGPNPHNSVTSLHYVFTFSTVPKTKANAHGLYEVASFYSAITIFLQ